MSLRPPLPLEGGFTAEEAGRLRAVTTALASGADEEVQVHALPWVQPVAGCRLTLVAGARDQAMVPGDGPASFVCGFTPATWDNVSGLIEPFEKGATGHQWLAGSPGDATLLLSVDGDW